MENIINSDYTSFIAYDENGNLDRKNTNWDEIEKLALNSLNLS